MKTIILGLTLLGIISPVQAASRAELDSRIHALAAKFEAMQANPTTRVPAETLGQAKGIVLLDLTKGGFGFAAQAGGGVALAKNESGDWSPVAFVRSNEGSFGFQAGGERDFCVLLLMTTDATERLAKSTADFGGIARGTAANNSSGVEGSFDSSGRSMLVYSERSGFYGGVAFKGGGLSADRNANEAYYGRFVTLSDVLSGRKVETTDAAKELAGKISEYSRK